jgi:hypothetical protein
MSDINFDVGRHEAAINQLLKNDEAIMTKLDVIDCTLAEQRGARKFGLWAAGAAGGLAGFAVKISALFAAKHI